jgi:hypothetical protein
MSSWKRPDRPERFAWKAWTVPAVRWRSAPLWNAFPA